MPFPFMLKVLGHSNKQLRPMLVWYYRSRTCVSVCIVLYGCFSCEANDADWLHVSRNTYNITKIHGYDLLGDCLYATLLEPPSISLHLSMYGMYG